MFNSFHLQSECCPNYIVLIPSLTCFNRSVVSIIPLLTGVSSKCFNFAKFIFYPFHFQLECCRNCSLSFLVHLASTGVVSTSILSLKLFFLAVFLVPCPTECFHFVHLHGILSFKLSNLSRFVVSLVCRRSNFVLPLPLPFLSGAVLRSRDEISCKWRSVVTPRDRRSRCLPCFRVRRVFYFCLLHSSCHHEHCILMFS